MVTIPGRYYHKKVKCQVVKVITIEIINMEVESYVTVTNMFFSFLKSFQYAVHATKQ